MIKSINTNQHIILRDILSLNGLDRFDADVTYGNGSFYSQIPQPKYKFDIDPQTQDTVQASSSNIPLADQSLASIVFDPPFLTYIKQGREHGSIMSKRFGGYWTYSELEKHYRETLAEAYRLLKPKGILVFKCQDIIHNHKMHCTHINIVNWANGLFRLKDTQILYKGSRMPMPEKVGEKPRKQQHARIHHCYFLTLERLTTNQKGEKL